MGLSKDLDALISEISKPDFQLTDALIQHISEISTSLQDDPEKLIELNMLVGVQLGRRKEYAHADEYFMACWPHAHRLNREEGMYAWPWGEEEVSPVDTLERIDLYQFIQPFYEVIEPIEYIAFLEFQLRCQEVVGMIRKGEYATANERLLGLFDHIPRSVHAKNDELSELRKEFREQRKLDLQVQVFDVGTFYHYLAISYWMISDLENARINFEESLWFRNNNKTDIYDLDGSYSNLGSIYTLLGEYQMANRYIQSSLEIAFELGENSKVIIILIQLATLSKKLGLLETSLKYSQMSCEKAEILKDQGMLSKSYRSLGNIHSCLNNYEEAIAAYLHSIHYAENDKEKSIVVLNYVQLLITLKREEEVSRYLQILQELSLNKTSIFFEFRYLLGYLSHLSSLGKTIKIPALKKFINIYQNEIIPREYQEYGYIFILKIAIQQDNELITQVIKDYISKYSNNYYYYIYLISKGKKELQGLEELNESEVETIRTLYQIYIDNLDLFIEKALNEFNKYVIINNIES
ncbi:MAG: tetratricopeptide repeat protein [Candidatus Heimdallarchaeota archaeon]|nr:tetratricopeptide repeat protein [Candidatus Heimdallarchaeota archaeon]